MFRFPESERCWRPDSNYNTSGPGSVGIGAISIGMQHIEVF
jgi:hypothetical protein